MGRTRQARNDGGTRLRRARSFAAGAIIPISLMQATPAGAVGTSNFLSREGTKAFADQWWNGTLGHPFERIGQTDCTNFVSSAWFHGGGVDMRANWFIRHNGSMLPSVVLRGHRDWAAPWAAAYNFVIYWSAYDQNEGYWYGLNPADTFTPARKGDAYLYDWGRGGGWSHLSMSVGFTSAGDKMAQHTEDRNNQFWNFGYRNESDPVVRGRMKSSYLRVHNSY